MNQISSDIKQGIEIKKKKQILLLILFVGLLASNLPDFFFSIVWLDDRMFLIFLKKITSYTILPLVIVLSGNKFLSSKFHSGDEKRLFVPNWISNIMIGSLLILSLWLGCLHASFEVSKSLCLSSDTVENLKQCIKEVERSKFNPSF